MRRRAAPYRGSGGVWRISVVLLRCWVFSRVPIGTRSSRYISVREIRLAYEVLPFRPAFSPLLRDRRQLDMPGFEHEKSGDITKSPTYVQSPILQVRAAPK